MPKISAPTIAEHRSAQHAAMLSAAEEILLTSGVESVTPAAVTARAGLGRSTFYEYFPSKDDLLVSVAREAFASWTQEVREAIAPASPGVGRLSAYIDVTLRLTADGRHEIANAMRDVPLSPKGRDAITAMHTSLNDPVVDMLTDLGVESPRLAAPLIHGTIRAAMSLVAAGHSPEDVARRTTALVLDGIVPA